MRSVAIIVFGIALVNADIEDGAKKKSKIAHIYFKSRLLNTVIIH